MRQRSRGTPQTTERSMISLRREWKWRLMKEQIKKIKKQEGKVVWHWRGSMRVDRKKRLKDDVACLLSFPFVWLGGPKMLLQKTYISHLITIIFRCCVILLSCTLEADSLKQFGKLALLRGRNWEKREKKSYININVYNHINNINSFNVKIGKKPETWSKRW